MKKWLWMVFLPTLCFGRLIKEIWTDKDEVQCGAVFSPLDTTDTLGRPDNLWPGTWTIMTNCDTVAGLDDSLFIKADSTLKARSKYINMGDVASNIITAPWSFVWGVGNVLYGSGSASCFGRACSVGAYRGVNCGGYLNVIGTNNDAFNGAGANNRVGGSQAVNVGGDGNASNGYMSFNGAGGSNVTTNVCGANVAGLQNWNRGYAAINLAGYRDSCSSYCGLTHGFNARAYGDSSGDTCIFVFGTGVACSLDYGVLFGDEPTDSLTTPHTFKVALDSAIMPQTRFTGHVNGGDFDGTNWNELECDTLLFKGQNEFLFATSNYIRSMINGGQKFAVGATKVLAWATFEAEYAVVLNQSGGDYDCRVEGDTDVNLIYTDAGNDRVGIGEATPAVKLDVHGGTTTDSLQVGTGNFLCSIEVIGSHLAFITCAGDTFWACDDTLGCGAP